MDLMSVLIGIAICLIAAVVLYFIAAQSFKEKTYEEVLAEQKKFADSLLTTKEVKAAAKEKEKKQNKKPSKPVKTKSSNNNGHPSTLTTPLEEKPHVEFEPDAEIIPEEPAATLPREKEAKKKTEKKDKVKPILRNKDHPVAPESFDPDVDSINHFMEHPPKDDLQLKAKELQTKPAGNKSSGTKQHPKPVVEEKIVATEVPVVEPIVVKETAFQCGPAPAPPQQPSTPVKKPKKKNTKGDSLEGLMAPDPGDELLLQLGGTEKLLSALRSLPLTSAELQTAIEVLLNRQQEAGTGNSDSEWMERGGKLDPIGALRKQLTDKEKALAEELEEKKVYQNKLKTLGAEMATERTRAAAARKQLEESLARQTNEMQVLMVRLQQSTDQHVAELSALRTQHKAALVQAQAQQKPQGPSEEQLRQIQRLQEEKIQLETHYATAQQGTQELANRIQQLEELLRLKEGQLVTQQHEVVKLHDALQATAIETRGRLEETERTKQLLEDRITTVDRELLMERSIAAQKENEVRAELQRLCLENQSLHLQLSGLAQAASDSARHQEDDAKWEALIRDKDKIVEEQRIKAEEAAKELERLRSENQTLAGELEASKSAVNQELEEQRRKNNELRDKNYKAMDALAAAEKALVEQQKKNAVVSAVPDVSELNRSISNGLHSLFPEMKLDPAGGQSFVDQLSEAIQELQRDEQTKAASQIQHYKTVLSQTEELLNRLQSRIEAEESNWKKQMGQQESDLAAVRQERDFWMEQCQKKEDVQQISNHSPANDQELELLKKEAEKERLAAVELAAQLTEERQRIQQLQEQLDQAKAELSAAKVGSLGYMIGWAAGPKSGSVGSAAVLAAGVRKNSLGTTSSIPQVTPVKSVISVATNGNGANGNGTDESPLSEEPVVSQSTGGGQKSGKNRKKNKAASHFVS